MVSRTAAPPSFLSSSAAASRAFIASTYSARAASARPSWSWASADSPLPETAAEDSVSFLPELLGNGGGPPRGAVVHHSISGKFALREGAWKLCFCAGSGGWSKGGGTASPQLYDLAADPGETVNLAGRHPDVVARLTHVWPDGRSTNIQEGALRLQYRDGFATPRPLVPGERQQVTVNLRSIAYLLPAGHRLRLQVAGTSFPRLERNLHGGGDNRLQSRALVARTRVHHGGEAVSALELPALEVAPVADAGRAAALTPGENRPAR